MSIIRNYKIKSDYDNLLLGMTVVVPEQKVKGAVIFSHGMAEHRLRYLEFMNYLADHGYLAVIHDHRGHGESVHSKEDYGYFYEDGVKGLVLDLNQVVEKIKKQYPHIPIYLFSHSMGTLIARLFLKENDVKIDGLIMSGPPVNNKKAKLGKLLVKGMEIFFDDHHRSNLLQKLTFGNYSKRFKNEKNKVWLCSNIEEVKKYSKSESCGFVFTLNGFYVLYSLLEQTYQKDYLCQKKELPILMLAGSEDPVIENETSFLKMKLFLEERGYSHIKTKLYDKKRHEILLEENKKEVYSDVLTFLEDTCIL